MRGVALNSFSPTGCLARNCRFRVLMSSCRGRQVGSGLTGLPDGTLFNDDDQLLATWLRLSRVFVGYDRLYVRGISDIITRSRPDAAVLR